MRTLALALLLVMWAAVSAQDDECAESELGYVCKKQMTEYFALHWSLGPTTSGGEAQEGEIAMAMVGQTTGWVGVGFPEEAGTMAPADIVLGWMGGLTTTINAYRPDVRSITDDNEDESVDLTGTDGRQSGDETTIQFVRSIAGFTVDVDIEGETPINVAVGNSDSLTAHSPDRRSSTTIQLSLGRRDNDTAPPPTSPSPANTTTPDEEEESPEEEEESPDSGDGCTASDAGYDCMREVSDEMTIHWTVGPADATGEVLEVSDGEVAMSLVGQTNGWVGVSFAEEPGRMNPADAVIGWVDGSDVTVLPYRITEQNVLAENEDASIGIRDVSGTEDGDVTTVSFIWTGEFTFDVDLASTVDMNWAVGPDDTLIYHGPTRGSIAINLQSGAADETEEPEEDEPVPAGAPSGSGCPPSDLGYSCMTSAGDPVFIHWTLGPAPASGDIPEVMEGEVAMAMVSATEGWVGISFAETSGSMNPADAIIGWVTGTEATVTPYRITEKRVSPDDEDASIGIRETSGEEVDGTTTVRFVAIGDFTFNVDFSEAINMNWGVGDADSLVQHSRRGSIAVNLQSGTATDTSPTLKYYKAHGSCMIIAWIGLAPLGVIIGRNKYIFMPFNQHLWFWLHRGVQLLAIASMLCGLIIALAEFDDPASTEGKRHRRIGISILTIGFFQALIPFFRPHLDSPYRFIFNYVHQWLGRAAVIIGIATVFLGIQAFDLLNDDNVDVWWVTCTVILGIYFLISAFGEISVSFKNMQDAQEKMRKKTDAPAPPVTEMT